VVQDVPSDVSGHIIPEEPVCDDDSEDFISIVDRCAALLLAANPTLPRETLELAAFYEAAQLLGVDEAVGDEIAYERACDDFQEDLGVEDLSNALVAAADVAGDGDFDDDDGGVWDELDVPAAAALVPCC
jgi:hypothetical protein